MPVANTSAATETRGVMVGMIRSDVRLCEKRGSAEEKTRALQIRGDAGKRTHREVAAANGGDHSRRRSG